MKNFRLKKANRRTWVAILVFIQKTKLSGFFLIINNNIKLLWSKLPTADFSFSWLEIGWLYCGLADLQIKHYTSYYKLVRSFIWPALSVTKLKSNCSNAGDSMQYYGTPLLPHDNFRTRCHFFILLYVHTMQWYVYLS
jgi:hypothetical protein